MKLKIISLTAQIGIALVLAVIAGVPLASTVLSTWDELLCQSLAMLLAQL